MVDVFAADDGWELDAGIVRPYLLTRGRTRPLRSVTLPVEAMLTSTALARATASTLPGEQRRIVDVCGAPHSVAELAVAVRTPLGVVRVLVADLVTVGMIDVHEVDDPADDIVLLHRLITRIEAIA
jgi:hypothetical protein